MSDIAEGCIKTQAVGLCFPDPKDPVTACDGNGPKGPCCLFVHTCQRAKIRRILTAIGPEKCKGQNRRFLTCISYLTARLSRPKPQVFGREPLKILKLKTFKIKHNLSQPDLKVRLVRQEDCVCHSFKSCVDTGVLTQASDTGFGTMV